MTLYKEMQAGLSLILLTINYYTLIASHNHHKKNKYEGKKTRHDDNLWYHVIQFVHYKYKFEILTWIYWGKSLRANGRTQYTSFAGR